MPKYLYWFIVAEAAGRKQLADAAYGAGKPGLNLENIRSVVVPLPPYAEQKSIVELIEEKLSVVDQLDQTIITALQQAEALRQSILKKAFSGQLVPQDPHDEPASALDPISTLRIEELMQELKKNYTIIIVTHNMQQAARVSDYTAMMMIDDRRAGMVIEFDETKNIFTRPKDKRTEDYVTGRFG